jgi:Tripartite tricarboxylate transporter family receptor
LAASALNRRDLLAAMLTVAGLAPAGQASADTAPALKVLLPYARGSFSARAFSLVEGGLARELGGPVEPLYTVGFQRAAETVAGAGPDEPVVLVVADSQLVVLPVVYADVSERPDLRPVAKLSRGISLALVVPSVSAWRSWSALTSAQHQRPLRVATIGSHSASGLFATILAKVGGLAIEQVPLASILADAVEAVDQHVDAAVVTTFDIEPINRLANDSLVPIVTSGAARSPDFPETPTVGEVAGDRRLAFTTSVSAYASRAMNDTLAARLTRAFLAAGRAPEAAIAATRMNFPLQVDGPEVVKETLERDRGVAMRYRELLERTTP